MKFHLYYEGLLKASQNSARLGQLDKHADLKHKIRQCFHKQMKEHWTAEPMLRDAKAYLGKNSFLDSFNENHKGHLPMVEAIATQHRKFGYEFVPLVRKVWNLTCALEVLILTRDNSSRGSPKAVLYGGDIDNRVKTLIDGLSMPEQKNQLTGNEIPNDDEKPFFSLLESDESVTELTVNADRLLQGWTDEELQQFPERAEDHFVKAFVKVEIQPLNSVTFLEAFQNAASANEW